eukprot:10684740-Alexandrium_andersonii.AAC.1
MAWPHSRAGFFGPSLGMRLAEDILSPLLLVSRASPCRVAGTPLGDWRSHPHRCRRMTRRPRDLDVSTT